MSKPEIKAIPIELIDANPFRRLGDYPYIEEKIEALRRSLQDVGFWEGVVARQTPSGRYQIAFGHHRIEAARREGLKEIPLILRELTDKQMLQFMSRENQEEYQPDFMVQLETWEAAVEFLKAQPPCRTKSCNGPPVIDVARFLGWTRTHGKSERENISDTARACSAAYSLIHAGLLDREALRGYTIKEVRVATERGVSRIRQTEETLSRGAWPSQEANKVKARIGMAVGEALRRHASEPKGKMRESELRGEVDYVAYRFAEEAKKKIPLFEDAGKVISNSIEKMLDTDITGAKLKDIVKALPHIELEQDKAMVRRINHCLGELIKKAQKWQKKMVVPEKKASTKTAPPTEKKIARPRLPSPQVKHSRAEPRRSGRNERSK